MTRSPFRGAAAILAATLGALGLSACVVLPVPHARSHGVVVVESGHRHGPPAVWRDDDRRGWGEHRREHRRDDRRDDRRSRDGHYGRH